MARATMTWLIDEVEGLLFDSENNHYTTAQYQRALDRRRTRITRLRLAKDAPETLYRLPMGGWEGVVDNDTGDWTGAPTIAIWTGKSSGATEITPDTWNLADGSFGFTEDQNDSYYFDGWLYDIYYAASDLCLTLALKPSLTPGAGETGGQIVGRYDYRSMAHEYRAMAMTRSIELVRARKNTWPNS
jgi:hypothetical protein